MEKIIGGIKRDCYPLTPAQMVHMYTLQFSPSDEVVNIGTGQFLQIDMNVAASADRGEIEEVERPELSQLLNALEQFN